MENPTVGKILKTLVFPEYCLKVPVISKFVKSRKVPNTGRSVKMPIELRPNREFLTVYRKTYTWLISFFYAVCYL